MATKQIAHLRETTSIFDEIVGNRSKARDNSEQHLRSIFVEVFQHLRRSERGSRQTRKADLRIGRGLNQGKRRLVGKFCIRSATASGAAWSPSFRDATHASTAGGIMPRPCISLCAGCDAPLAAVRFHE